MEEKKFSYSDMMLESASGYMMPFAMMDGEEIVTSLGFGEQTHPQTGQKFRHNGIDLVCKGKELYAVANGLIIGAGQDAIHENYIVAKYGKYEVTYGHVSEAYTPYGTEVKAGQVIAKSGDFLHLGVTFDGRVINPMDFLGMLYSNIQQLAAMHISAFPDENAVDGQEIHTKYDKDQDEILMMMVRWLPTYLNELAAGSYSPSKRVESNLRNIFAQSADKKYFYEQYPSISNPLGLTNRALPLVEKVQNLLIADFLHYMALCHGQYVSTWGEEQKKNFLRPSLQTA